MFPLIIITSSPSWSISLLKSSELTWRPVFPRVSVSVPSEREQESDWLVLRPVLSRRAPPFLPEPIASPLRRTAALPPSRQNPNPEVTPGPAASHEKRSSSVCNWCGLSAPQTWRWPQMLLYILHKIYSKPSYIKDYNCLFLC